MGYFGMKSKKQQANEAMALAQVLTRHHYTMTKKSNQALCIIAPFSSSSETSTMYASIFWSKRAAMVSHE